MECALLLIDLFLASSILLGDLRVGRYHFAVSYLLELGGKMNEVGKNVGHS